MAQMFGFGKDAAWFEMLFGFEEVFDGGKSSNGAHFRTVQSQFNVEPPMNESLNQFPENYLKEGVILTSVVNKKKYRAGHFFTPSLDQLREKGRAALKAKGEKSIGNVKWSEVVVGDVLEMHQQNPGALFQVASQFNCLEFASPKATPEDGVTYYCADYTQGPACSLAAAASTVVRNYFVPVPGAPNAQVGQRHDCQINNLCDLDAVCGNNQVGDEGKYWNVVNGYTWSTEEKLLEFKDHLEKTCQSEADWDAILGHVRIGVHAGVETTFTSRWKPISNEGSIVSQAFCSAISCAYSGVSLKYWTPLARLILCAAYEATLWTAVVEQAAGRGNGVVYLTMIGGGVFGNSPAWIGEAIARACTKLNAEGATLDVRIAHFRRIDDIQSRHIKESFSQFTANDK